MGTCMDEYKSSTSFLFGISHEYLYSRVLLVDITSLAAIRLSTEVQMKLPAWYHPFAEQCSMMSYTARCLLRKHRAVTVADLVKLANKLNAQQLGGKHAPTIDCTCCECEEDRAGGCINPHACANEALARINELAPKYNPLQIGEQHDKLSLTHRRKERNFLAKQNDTEITFNPTMTCKDSIAECFRVFVNPERLSPISTSRFYVQDPDPNPRKIEVYTDRACWDNGKANARCGGGIWFGPDHLKNAAIQVPSKRQSNQVGELAAVIVGDHLSPTLRPPHHHNRLTIHDRWADITPREMGRRQMDRNREPPPLQTSHLPPQETICNHLQVGKRT